MLNALSRLFGRAEPDAPDHPAPTAPTGGGGGTAVSMTGGGARAAYQAGVLRGVARIAPGFQPDILTGVSAGGLNAAFLAATAHLPLDESVERMVDVWHDLRAENVYRTDRPGVAGTLARLVRRPAVVDPPEEGGLLDTSPLHAFVDTHLGTLGEPVPAIGAAIAAGRLGALAVTATCYATGEAVTFVEGHVPDVPKRRNRRLVAGPVRPEHVLASAALPFFFPAVQVDGDRGPMWYGDGGIRLTAPLSPALRLGADRILSINTRAAGATEPTDAGVYPPASRILGTLMNAVFLDVLDRDAQTLRRINALLAEAPPHAWGGFRPVDLLVIRPSVDLAKLASGYEPILPPSMRVAIGGAGRGSEAKSPDWLSMLLFAPAYVARLVALGEGDAWARADEIRAFLSAETPTAEA